MKKFLSKLPVMVTFVVVAVLLLALNIGLLARPVSYGMAYKGKITQQGMTVEGEYTFKNNKVLKMHAKVEEESVKVDMDMEIYYLRQGNKVMIAPYFKSVPDAMKEVIDEEYIITEEQFDEFVKQAKEDKTTWDAMWESDTVMKVNAFRAVAGDEKLTCIGAVVYAVVMNIVEVALITFATLSVVFFVLDKKSSKKTTEQAA